MSLDILAHEAAPAAGDGRMECGVCWAVYDPGLGDPAWQVPSGTPFAALPDNWRCPHCDAARDRFLRPAHAG